MKFANVLKDLRTEKELSQKQLSQKVNISQSTIARWELSQTEPTASALIILADFFNVTIEQLLGLEDL